jgi:hypothetical protein
MGKECLCAKFLEGQETKIQDRKVSDRKELITIIVSGISSKCYFGILRSSM